MKFMTPATVRNLPNYQREDRANLLMTQEAEDKARAEKDKKLLVQFGLDIQDAADKSSDPDTLNKSLGAIREKYRSMGMTPDMMQMGANLARQFKQDFMANQDRQERKDDRGRLLRKENIAESDVNLLGQIASGNIKPMGGDEFMVQATEQDASQGLSGAGQLRLIDIKNSMEDRGTAKEDRLLRNKLTNAQIAKTMRNDDDVQVVQDNEGNVSLVNKVTGEVKQTGAKGKTTRNPDAEPLPNSFKYKTEKNKYVLNATKDLTDDEKDIAKQKYATEFDANMQGWEKVSHPKTGKTGYRKPDGTIVDVYGGVIAKTGGK